MRLVNWNVEWATSRAHRSAEILNRINIHSPEVVCLTETGDRDLLSDGHVILSGLDYGYKRSRGYKVLLWSAKPWRAVDSFGSELLPSGRFVAGTTETSIGDLAVIGICIPWFGSRTGKGAVVRRRRWQDHEEFIAGLGDIIRRKLRDSPRLAVVGDFNQRIKPGRFCPEHIRLSLLSALKPLRILTDDLTLRGRANIDHIAVSDALTGQTGVIDNLHNQKRLSDHFGITAELHTT